MDALAIGFLLDRRWHWMRGEMERSKRPDLLELARILDEAGVGWAVIGGVALQAHQEEPRTTLDVDIAVTDRAAIPRAALLQAGFCEKGSHAFTDHWIAPGATPVQFTDDPALHAAIARAEPRTFDGVALRILRADDLLHEKLRAAADPARRRSKRLQDLADAHALLERDPSLRSGLSPAETDFLERLPR